MYIIKNALRCIGRAKGRNVLISIIALVIAVSACLGLSIRQAAESAKESTLSELNITATISYDRSSMMNDIKDNFKNKDGSKGGFDREQFADVMGNASSLTLEDYEKYAKAESVQDFYYTLTASFDGTDDLAPVTDETEDDKSESDSSNSSSNSNGFGGGMNFPGGSFGGSGGKGFTSSDFSVIGYSSDSSMTSFIDGTASVLDGGKMFEEGTTEQECIVSEELALYNELSVINKGDEIPVDQRDKMFERFYRLDTVRNSEDNHYGLGLSIAKSIAGLHKGRIEVLCYDGLVEFKVQIPAE